MQGKTCVITGATSGIGRAAALALAAAGARLVLHGRSESAGEEVTRRIRLRGGEAEFIRADLSVLEEVRSVADHLAGQYPRVDVLINNAGARFDRYERSADGFELTFATNYLGHFLLTGLLIDRLLCAPAGRIITVSSSSHHAAANPIGEWQLTAENFDRRQAYARAKLAQLLFAYNLADRLRQTRVTSNAADPGGVATRFARNNGLLSWARHLLSHAIRRELVSARRGAEGLVFLARSAAVDQISGKYFRRLQAIPSSAASYDSSAARELWDWSMTLLGQDGKVAAAWARV